MRSFLYVLGAGWSELLRILRKHAGRSGERTEDNMTVIFWVCVVVLAVALVVLIPWQVLVVSAIVMALLLLALGWSVRK